MSESVSPTWMLCSTPDTVGTCRFAPTTRSDWSEMMPELFAMIDSVVTPKRAAMPLTVSPDWTAYDWYSGGGPAGADGCSSLASAEFSAVRAEVRCSEADAGASEAGVAAVAAVAPASGPAGE